MTKTSRDSTSANEAAFHKHYAAIWGEERWRGSLYPALSAPTRQVALVNSYVHPFQLQDHVSEAARLEPVSFYSVVGQNITCYTLKPMDDDVDPKQALDEHIALPTPLRVPASTGTKPLLSHWNLDAASVLASGLLSVQPDEDVLDLCAAPGGKSVALAQVMAGSRGRLVSNEADRTRYRRLTENLKSYLPPELFESKVIQTCNIDATDPLAARKLSIGTKSYDKVLVDAPCSSERHIIHAHLAAQAGNRAAAEMANWRPGSSKRLAKTQVDLLMTALRSVRLGGTVLYATCSIEPTENDGVIEKMLANTLKEVRKGQKWQVVVGSYGGEVEQALERDWAERTKYGWIALPDHPSGGRWGPLFFAVLTKVEAAA